MEKPCKTGWRFLFDLSYPPGFSVNDGISKEDASVTYVKVMEICEMILDIGVGAQLCKFDIERAYRHVPVHPDDRRLLGYLWNGNYFVDLTLPFGGRSCCSIFNGVGDLFTAVFNHHAERTMFRHYLDDFLGVADPNSAEGEMTVEKDFGDTLSLCDTLGIPLNPNKTVHPTTKLVFLGYELDTMALTISLPEPKRLAYMAAIEKMRGKRAVTKKELESLIGKLMHASACIPIGRAFFRSLINKNTRLPYPKSWVGLNRDEKLNLDWWFSLLDNWNGITLMRFCRWEPCYDLQLASDAALSDGFGIVHGNEWVSGKWPPGSPSNIAILEMIPLCLAAAIWGKEWSGKTVLFHTDSMAVHFSAEGLLPADLHLAALVRELASISVLCDFHFRVKHIPGKSNTLADLLSRSRHVEFFKLLPSADPVPKVSDLDYHVARLIKLAA